jgi:hypothetical protein
MVAWIALMAAEVHSEADGYWQIGINLYQALCVSLIPVVSRPWLVIYVFETKRLVFRKIYME